MAITTVKKRVLIVSFYFPPTNAIAAVRLGKFAKYLPQFGWEPIVLTADTSKDLPQTLPSETDENNVFRTPYFAALRSSLSRNLKGNQVPPPGFSPRRFTWKQPIYRAVRLARPIYTLSILAPLITDPIGWYAHAVEKGREILDGYKIDAIFSSYGPSTSHLVACRLHQMSGIPWVAEFRDEWSSFHYARTTRLLRFLEARIEKGVVRGSSLLIAAGEGMVAQLNELHRKQVVTIHNGFDEEDYGASVPLTSKFTITYTGRIYPGKQDPTLLLKASRELYDEGKILPSNFEVRFFGGEMLGTLPLLVERYNLGELVKVHGQVPFRESVSHQKESSALLFLKWNDPLAKGIYTGKIFEYLGAQRPILAIGSFKDELVDNLITESGTGIALDSVDTIKSVLSHWLEEWRQKRQIVSHWQPRADVIQRYTRKRQAETLAQLLDEVSSAKA